MSSRFTRLCAIDNVLTSQVLYPTKRHWVYFFFFIENSTNKQHNFFIKCFEKIFTNTYCCTQIILIFYYISIYYFLFFFFFLFSTIYLSLFIFEMCKLIVDNSTVILPNDFFCLYFIFYFSLSIIFLFYRNL